MKEYVITIENQEFHVQVKKLRTDTAIVEVNGKEYEVGVSRRLRRNITPLEVKPVLNEEPEKVTQISPETATSTGNVITAPLPGLVLSILVKEGEKVSTGQTLIKMEAMKMENEIKANQVGVVEKILVKEGDTVQENTPLLSFRD